MASRDPPDHTIEVLIDPNNQHLDIPNRQASIQTLDSVDINIENLPTVTTSRLPEFRRKKIHSREELRKGDHVAWHRMCGYWHHAIFVDIDRNDNKRIMVYEASWNKKENEANFHQESTEFRGCTDVVYRITYVDWMTERHTQETMQRAKLLVRQSREKNKRTREENLTYDILDNNCEHSARWCKTGIRISTQVNELTGPTGCVTLSVKSILLLIMRLCGVLVLFSIEAIWPEDPVRESTTTVSTTFEETTRSSYDMGTKELILAVVYTIFNGVAFMVYQLYTKCNEIKELDEPDDIEPNMCYSCCMVCYRRMYGQSCTKCGNNCYESKPWLGCGSCCTQGCWLCCVCCCKTPCVNAELSGKKQLRGRNGCWVLKTRECCKLYTGDVIMIVIREIVCVGTPLAVMILVEKFLEDYSDLRQAGIGLGISLGCVAPVYFVVYCLTHMCRSCLVCSFRCGERCCKGPYVEIQNDMDAHEIHA